MRHDARWEHWSFPLTVATILSCTFGAALALPEWVPRQWSREDGPVEWAGFASFALAGAIAVVVVRRCRANRRHALAALAFGVVMVVAAGEEISWGQRVLDLDTPEVLVDGNRQDELNLHNLDGLQSKAVIAQLAVAGAGALLPLRFRRRWAHVGVPFFLGYLAYRGGRALVVIAGHGPAGRNAEVAELLLGLGLLSLIVGVASAVKREPSSLDHEGVVSPGKSRQNAST